MDKLLLASKVVNIGDEVCEKDINLVADIERLISIVDMIVDTIGDFILEVHVVPMNILQLKFCDVKRLKFCITYNSNYTGEEFNDKRNYCDELIEALVKDEFDGVSTIEKTEYSSKDNWKYPTILLYSLFGEFNIEELSDNEYVTLYLLCTIGDYNISIPYSYLFQKIKCMYIHCSNIIDLPNMRDDLLNSREKYGVVFEEYNHMKNKYKNNVYVALTNKCEIKYKIPYMYLDTSSFNTQRIESILKPTIE